MVTTTASFRGEATVEVTLDEPSAEPQPLPEPEPVEAAVLEPEPLEQAVVPRPRKRRSKPHG